MIEIINYEPTYGEWIPVAKRYPKNDDLVIMSYRIGRKKGVMFGYYFNSDWHQVPAGMKIDAWMPLPKPYEKEEI